MTTKLHSESLTHIREIALDALETVMSGSNLDLIIANSDSQLISYASMLGWPIGTFPIGALSRNGQRWGGFVLGRREADILRFMEAWEKRLEEDT